MKKIISNTAVQVVGKIISASSTFVVTYLAIRHVGAGFYGDFAKITTLLTLGFTALDFGINAHVLRLLTGKTKKLQKQIFTNTLLLRTLLSLLVMASTTLIIFLLPGTKTSGYTPQIKLTYLLGVFSIFLYGIHLTSNAIFQLQLRYDKTVLASSLGSLTFLLLSLATLLYSPTLEYLTLSFTAGYLTTALLSILLAKNYLTKKTSLKKVKKILQSSLPLGVVLLLSILATKSDTLILGIFRPSAEVGEYNFAYKILDFALVLPIFTMNSLYPLLLKKGKNQKTLLKKTLLALLAVSLLGTLTLYLASPLIRLVKPQLDLAITSLKILSFSLPFFYLTAPLMWDLIAKEKEKTLIKIYAAASFFNIAGNLLFTPTYGAKASAYLTILTELGILTWLTYAETKTHKKGHQSA